MEKRLPYLCFMTNSHEIWNQHTWFKGRAKYIHQDFVIFLQFRNGSLFCGYFCNYGYRLRCIVHWTTSLAKLKFQVSNKLRCSKIPFSCMETQKKWAIWSIIIVMNNNCIPIMIILYSKINFFSMLCTLFLVLEVEETFLSERWCFKV